jgi:pyrimidine-specific ribonucleoside hydrolase
VGSFQHHFGSICDQHISFLPHNKWIHLFLSSFHIYIHFLGFWPRAIGIYTGWLSFVNHTPETVRLDDRILHYLDRLVPAIDHGRCLSPSLQALTVSPTAKRQAIIIDTDMSNDDIAAILFLLHRPELDIRALSVVNGVAHVKPGVENARRLLALTGRKDIQVAGGPDEPLAGDRSFPESWRSSLDLSLRPALPSVPPSATELSAPQLILQQVNSSPEPVRLIALGPLTNVALAIKMDATLPTKLEDIFISGGAIVVPGIIHDELPSNPNATAEWNLYIDPLAADQVFRSGARLALAPLDVTHTSGPHPLLLYPSFVDKFFASAARPDAQFMAAIMRNSQLMQTSLTPLNAIPLWDLAAAVIAVEPQVCTNWQDLALHLVLDPDNVAGQTIVEKGQPSNAHVCMGGDQATFEKILTEPDITGSPSH